MCVESVKNHGGKCRWLCEYSLERRACDPKKKCAAARSTRLRRLHFNIAETAAVFSPEALALKISQKAKFSPLRIIPKLFLGPSMMPKLKSLVQPMWRANRNSTPAPNCVRILVSLPK